mmetsp:Transcript_7552/g.14771  ORF Transcript_7552/g.14771 Transcript_7552/m.14771 type:complete len:215 (+) Transcript_7552:616-1260(+)
MHHQRMSIEVENARRIAPVILCEVSFKVLHVATVACDAHRPAIIGPLLGELTHCRRRRWADFGKKHVARKHQPSAASSVRAVDHCHTLLVVREKAIDIHTEVYYSLHIWATLRVNAILACADVKARRRVAPFGTEVEDFVTHRMKLGQIALHLLHRVPERVGRVARERHCHEPRCNVRHVEVVTVLLDALVALLFGRRFGRCWGIYFASVGQGG